MHGASGINWTGLALFITALGAFITSVGTFIRQGINERSAQAQRENLNTKVGDLHDLVNGQSNKLNAALSGEAFEKGKAEGVESERNAHP